MSIRYTLRDLEYLVALAEELHFGRAAERCFVSQPTLSGQIKKLEESLGLQLMERSNKRVIMTAAGSAVVEAARRTLAEASTIETIAKTFRDPLGGELHLGLIPTIAPYLLPLIMPALKQQLPNLKLFLHEQQTATLLVRLAQAELDLLVLALPVPGTAEFAERDLYNEPFQLAVPRAAVPASKTHATLDDLHQYEVLLLEEGHCLRGHALDVCFSAGAREYAGFRGTSLETIRQMVGEGIGATLIPHLAVPVSASPNDTVRYIPFDEPTPGRRISLLHRSTSSRLALFDIFANIVMDCVKEPLTHG